MMFYVKQKYALSLYSGSKLVFRILRLISGYLIRIRMLSSNGISDWNFWIIPMQFTLLTKFRPENNYKMQQNETEDAENNFVKAAFPFGILSDCIGMQNSRAIWLLLFLDNFEASWWSIRGTFDNYLDSFYQLGRF